MLFNFQGPISSPLASRRDSFVIIALCFAFVNTFFKTFLTFFQVFSSFFVSASPQVAFHAVPLLVLPSLYSLAISALAPSLEATRALYHTIYRLSIPFLSFFQLFSFLSINVHFSCRKCIFLCFFNIYIDINMKKNYNIHVGSQKRHTNALKSAK